MAKLKTETPPEPPGPVWWVLWADAQEQSLDLPGVSTAALAANLSCGCIVAKHPDRIILLNSVSSSGETNLTVIPRGWIIKKWKVSDVA